MAKPVKIFPTSSLIIMQNLVVVYHTVCTHVRGPKNLGEAGTPSPWDGDVVDLLKTRYSLTCATTPNFVVVGQTILVHIGSHSQKIYAGPNPLGWERG